MTGRETSVRLDMIDVRPASHDKIAAHSRVAEPLL